MNGRTASLIVLILALPFARLLVGCSDKVSANTAVVSPASSAEVPMVRVLLQSDVPTVTIRAGGPLIASRPDGTEDQGPVRLKLPDAPIVVTREGAGWRIGDLRLSGDVLVLQPERDEPIGVGDASNEGLYRGNVRLVPQAGGRFAVVNDIDVERYLMGVLPKEILPEWSEAAHRAQAVVARTYALYEVKTAGQRRSYFDVYDDTKSQVYGGALAETPKARRAVRETTGQVVAHETPVGLRIFKAYFHSTSGGVTLGVDDAFNQPPVTALSAQTLGDAGRLSGRFEWDPVLVSKEELTRRMTAWGKANEHPIRSMRRLHELNIISRNAHGRPNAFEAIDTVGNRYALSAEEARWSVNADRGDATPIYSGWFTPINNEKTIVFAEGRGWGHGVGMCQWSAEGFAKEGMNYRQIVARSYPETRLVRAY
ncbi:MAG: SpoIID/LytB domain-containing protein [Planctomycetota bacterium]